jgi:hypothetical protein
LSLQLPGSDATAVGEAVEVAANGSVAFSFSGRVQCQPTMDCVLELINGRCIINVLDSATSNCLATASLDMLEFALGASSLDLGDVALCPKQGDARYLQVRG